MEVHERIDPATGRAIVVWVHDVTQGEYPLDDYRTIVFECVDGTFETTFWSDPSERAPEGSYLHWCEEPGMVIVQKLEIDHVLAAVDRILAEGALEEACLRL